MDRFKNAKKAKAIVEEMGGLFVSHNRLSGLTSYFKPVAPNVRRACEERLV